MGGHEKGEVASATVCETLSRVILSAWHSGEVLSDELFLQALSAAYDALDAKDNGEERKMGTTLTFLCLHAGGATVAPLACRHKKVSVVPILLSSPLSLASSAS